MSAKQQVEQILQENAMRPSGGCLPALLLAGLLAAAVAEPVAASQLTGAPGGAELIAYRALWALLLLAGIGALVVARRRLPPA